MEYPKSQHGNYKIRVEGKVLFIKGIGSWNQETVNHFCASLLELIKPISHNPWCMIVDLMEWELCAPDAWDDFDRVLGIFLDNGLIFQAIMTDTIIAHHLMERQKDRAPSPLKTEFHESEQAAITACEKHLKSA